MATEVIEGISPEVIRELIDDVRELKARTATRSSEYTPDMAALTRMLAARSNDSLEKALLKALTLYGLALDAREKGNRLVIINDEDEIIHDVIGFDTSDQIVDSVPG